MTLTCKCKALATNFERFEENDGAQIHSLLNMIEDLIHGPRSSAERAEKRDRFGPPIDQKERMVMFMAKLDAQAKQVRRKLPFDQLHFPSFPRHSID